jgi:hypothetical protein
MREDRSDLWGQRIAGEKTGELVTYLQRLKGSGNMDEEGCQDFDKAVFPLSNRSI